jgi:hypothetical protein
MNIELTVDPEKISAGAQYFMIGSAGWQSGDERAVCPMVKSAKTG